MSGSVFDKLELAKRLASKINLKSNAAAQLQQTTESFLTGKPGQPVITATLAVMTGVVRGVIVRQMAGRRWIPAPFKGMRSRSS